MYTPLISVIIPTYHSNAQTFDISINSLLNQTLKNIEFIFIDDKCIDETIQNIQKYAKNDSRIKIIHNQQNSGSGISRNKGIEIAKGEYLAFFDIDDYVDLDFYEKLYNEAQKGNFDIVKASRCTIQDEDKSYSTLNSQILDFIQKNGIEKLCKIFTWEHTTAIYKRSLVNKYNIQYGASRMAHDTTFLVKLSYYAKNIKLVNNAYYYYKITKGSSTQNKNLSYYLDNIVAMKERLQFIETIQKDIAQDFYLSLIVDQISLEINRYELLMKDVKLKNKRREVFNTIKKEIHNFKYDEKILNQIKAVSKKHKYLLEGRYFKFKSRYEKRIKLKDVLKNIKSSVDVLFSKWRNK